MSTTRHLINRQRRLAAASRAARPGTADAPAAPRDRTGAARTPTRAAARTASRASVRTAVRANPGDAAALPATEPATQPAPEPATGPDVVRPPGRRVARAAAVVRRAAGPLRRPAALTALLVTATVLLGCFAAIAAHRAADLRDSAATGNSALTDAATTAQVKAAVTAEVNAVFSYDYADPARTDTAAAKDLTGQAVAQYATLLAQVRAQATKQKLVLTTTVTQAGVAAVDGERARLLVYADQRSTSTADAGRTSYAAAMFAVDAVRRGNTWLITSIDTFA